MVTVSIAQNACFADVPATNVNYVPSNLDYWSSWSKTKYTNYKVQVNAMPPDIVKVILCNYVDGSAINHVTAIGLMLQNSSTIWALGPISGCSEFTGFNQPKYIKFYDGITEIKGFAFKDFNGEVTEFKTNDVTDSTPNSGWLELKGKMVGILGEIITAEVGRPQDYIPVVGIRARYNRCLCHDTSFVNSGNLPQDIIIEIYPGGTSPVTYFFGKILNSVQELYPDTDCGTYKIDISPTSKSWMTFQKTDGINIDTIYFDGMTNSDLGTYPYQMTISPTQTNVKHKIDGVYVTGSEYTVSSYTHNFNIKVIQCQVDEVQATQVVSDYFSQTFEIVRMGADVVTTVPYAFEQLKDCGYVILEEIIDLPPFVTHNDADKTFTMSNPTISDVGLNTFTIKASVSFLDQTQAQTSVSTSIAVNILVTDPCQTSNQFVGELGLVDMETFILNSVPTNQVLTKIQDQISLDMPNYDGFTFCGERSFEIIDSANYEPFLTLLPDGLTLNLESDDVLKEGEYDVTIRMKLDAYPSIFKEQTIKVRIQPCKVVDFVFTEFPDYNQQYTIGSATMQIGPYQTAQDPLCGHIITFEALNLPTQFGTHLPPFVEIQTNDLTQRNNYEVTIKATLQEPKDYTRTSYTYRPISQKFMLELVDPCETSTITNFLVDDMSIEVSHIAETQTIVDPMDFASQMYASKDGYSLCGPRLISVIPLDLNGDQILVFDASSRTISIQVSNHDLSGDYTFEVIVILQNYDHISETKTFTVTVLPCDISSYLVGTKQPEIVYTIGQGLLTTGAYDFVQTFDCHYPETITVAFDSALNGVLIADTNARTFTIDTGNLGLVGTYSISIDSYIDEILDPVTKQTQTWPQTYSFNLVLQDLCATSQFLGTFTIPEVTIYVKDVTSFIYDLAKLPDEISTSYGIKDGFDLCGERTFEILSPSDFSNYLTMNQDSLSGEYQLSFYTADEVEIGQKIITIRQYLANYPSVFIDVEFTLNIEPCQIFSFLASKKPTSPITYKIGSGPSTLGAFGFTQDHLCGYPEYFEISPVLPSGVITFNEASQDFTVDTSKISDKQIIQVTVKGKIFAPSEISDQFTFEIIIENPCETSVLDQFSISDFDVFVRKDAEVRLLEIINDSASLNYGNKDGTSLCGARSYSIASPTGSASNYPYLVLDVVQNTLTVQTDDASYAGVHDFTIQLKLDDYTHSEAIQTFEFKVTINTCPITSFDIETQPNSPITYIIGSGPLSTGTAYSFKQVQDCLYEELVEIQTIKQGVFEPLPSFIIHNSAQKDFTIETDDLTKEGIITITIDSQIQVPNSYSDLTTQKWSQQISFDVTFENPCHSTDLASFTASAMTTHVKKQPEIQLLMDVLDSASQNYGPSKVDGMTFCGKRIYEISSVSPINPNNAIYISGQQLIVDSQDFNDANTYTVDIKVRLEDYPDKFATTQITVVIDHCPVSTFTASVTPTTYSYLVGQQTVTTGIYQFVQDFDCGYDFTVDVLNKPAFVTHDSVNNNLSVFTEDLADSNSYEIDISAEVSTPLGNLQATAKFTLIVGNSCLFSEFLSFDVLNMETYVTGPTQEQVLTLVKDQTSISFGNQDGYTFCGARHFSIVGATGFLSLGSVNGLDVPLLLQATDFSHEGVHNLEIKIELDAYGTIFKKVPFIVTVNTCQITSFTASQTLFQLQYIIGLGPLTTDPYDLIQVNNCGYPVSFDFNPSLQSFIMHDEINKYLLIDTSDEQLAQVYTFDLIATIDVPRDYNRVAEEFTRETVSISYIIDVVSQCQITVFEEILADNMSAHVHQSAQEQLLQLPKDSSSLNYGNQDGYTRCGQRVFEIVDAPSFAAFLQLENLTNKLTLYSASESDVGSHLVTLRVYLVDTPTVEETKIITINIVHCPINSFAPKEPDFVFDYNIGSGVANSQGYEFIQDFSCGYIETVTISGLDSRFITQPASQNYFEIQTDNLSLAGQYVIVVNSRITVPPSNQILSEDVVYTVNLIDPCLTTDFNTITIQDMTAHVKQPLQTQLIGELFDKSSLDFGNKDGLSFCGPRSITILNASIYQEFLTIDQSNGLYTIALFADDFSQAGTYSITFSIVLENYPTQTFEIPMVLTIKDCPITSFIPQQTPISITYTIGQGQMIGGDFDFIQDYPCDYPWSSLLTTPSLLPSWLTQDKAAKNFKVQTDDKSLEQVYAFKLQAQINEPPLSKLHSADIDYTITLNDPCKTTEFDSFTINKVDLHSLGSTKTVILDPTDSASSAYGPKDGLTFCGDRIYTIVNLVDVSHILTLTGNQISIEAKSLSDRGQYFVTVQAQLKDYPDRVKETTFEIIINECQITSFNVGTQPSLFTYTIGSGPITGSAYDFVQVDDCAYDEKIEIVNLPSYVTHNSITQDFTINTADLSLEQNGVDVTIKATIQVPLDFSENAQVREVSTTATFKVVMINPCHTSVLEQISLNDVQLEVRQTKDIPLDVLKDTASTLYGAKDGVSLCGPRKYRIQSSNPDSSSILSLDSVSNIITLSANSESDVNTYKVNIESYLVNYPDVNVLKEEWSIIIDYCQVTGIEFTQVSDQIYSLAQDPLIFEVGGFTQTPACGYELDYSNIRLKNGSEYSVLPSHISVQIVTTDSPPTFDVSVQTSDPALSGIYVISIVGQVPSMYMTVAPKAEHLVTVTIDNPCTGDTITPVGTLADQTYYIGVSGVVTVTPTWDQSMSPSACPTSYLAVRIVAGQEEPLDLVGGPLSLSMIDGTLQIQTTDFDLDLQTWTIKVSKTSFLSLLDSNQKTGSFTFDVTFRDECWDAVLTPALFSLSSQTYYLFDTQLIQYSRMQSSMSNCGSLTSELVYISGSRKDMSLPQGADLSFYTITQSIVDPEVQEIQGVIQAKNWVGTHKFILKSTLGTPSPEPTRGISGLYNSVNSNEFTLKIIDPCINSIVNSDSALGIPATLNMPKNVDQYTFQFKGPSNSVSLSHGNGYDICGELKYSIYDADKNELYNLANLDIQVNRVTNGQDRFSLITKQDINGSLVKKNLVVQIELMNFPTSTMASFNMIFEFQMCSIESLSPPDLKDMVIVAEQTKDTKIDITFKQYPCTYPSVYQITIYDSATGKKLTFNKDSDLPDFMERETENQSEYLIINQPSKGDVGNYRIEIINSLEQDGTLYQAQTDFNLNIVSSTGIIAGPPSQLPTLLDQFVELGGSLNYSIGKNQTDWGSKIDFDIDVGSAFQFLTYDESTQTFIIPPNSTETYHVGSHSIVVKATYTDQFGYVRTEKQVFDVVIQSETQKEENNSDFIYWHTWDGDVAFGGEEMGPYDPDQPIPFIVSLSTSGVLRIGWDRTMIIPEDYQQIPEEMIAIRDISYLEGAQIELSSQAYVSTNSNRRRNLKQTLFKNETTGEYEVVDIRHSLELKLIQPQIDDMPEIETLLSYEMLAFNETYMDILIFFDEIKISESGFVDKLIVTFWGTKFFASKKGGEVRYGTRLVQSISRLLTPDEARILDFVNGFLFMYPVFILSILLLFLFAYGSLLPFWMFLNTLSLIAHLPLFNSLMPARVSYILNQYLDLIRLNWGWLKKSITENYQLEHYDQALMDPYLRSSGYSSPLFAQNLTVILYIAAIVALIWVILAIKDYYGSRVIVKRNGLPLPLRIKATKFFNKTKHSPQCNNFIVRFIYVFFIDIALCTLLSISVVELETSAQTFQLSASIIFWIVFSSFFIFILYQLVMPVHLIPAFIKVPYHRNMYANQTVWNSLWQIRPLSSINFQLLTKLRLRLNQVLFLVQDRPNFPFKPSFNGPHIDLQLNQDDPQNAPESQNQHEEHPAKRSQIEAIIMVQKNKFYHDKNPSLNNSSVEFFDEKKTKVKKQKDYLGYQGRSGRVGEVREFNSESRHFKRKNQDKNHQKDNSFQGYIQPRTGKTSAKNLTTIGNNNPNDLSLDQASEKVQNKLSLSRNGLPFYDDINYSQPFQMKSSNEINQAYSSDSLGQKNTHLQVSNDQRNNFEVEFVDDDLNIGNRSDHSQIAAQERRATQFSPLDIRRAGPTSASPMPNGRYQNSGQRNSGVAQYGDNNQQSFNQRGDLLVSPGSRYILSQDSSHIIQEAKHEESMSQSTNSNQFELFERNKDLMTGRSSMKSVTGLARGLNLELEKRKSNEVDSEQHVVRKNVPIIVRDSIDTPSHAELSRQPSSKKNAEKGKLPFQRDQHWSKNDVSDGQALDDKYEGGSFDEGSDDEDSDYYSQIVESTRNVEGIRAEDNQSLAQQMQQRQTVAQSYYDDGDSDYYSEIVESIHNQETSRPLQQDQIKNYHFSKLGQVVQSDLQHASPDFEFDRQINYDSQRKLISPRNILDTRNDHISDFQTSLGKNRESNLSPLIMRENPVPVTKFSGDSDHLSKNLVFNNEEDTNVMPIQLPHLQSEVAIHSPELRKNPLISVQNVSSRERTNIASLSGDSSEYNPSDDVEMNRNQLRINDLNLDADSSIGDKSKYLPGSQEHSSINSRNSQKSQSRQVSSQKNLRKRKSAVLAEYSANQSKNNQKSTTPEDLQKAIDQINVGNSIILSKNLYKDLRFYLQSNVVLAERYKTIFYGLKLASERNVALVHPLQYLFRRVLYVIGILCLNTTPVLGVFCLFFVPTIWLLVYVVHEQQWEDSDINKLHIMNEGFLYMFGILMLAFTEILTEEARQGFGIVFIVLFEIFIVLNCLYLGHTLLKIFKRVRADFHKMLFIYRKWKLGHIGEFKVEQDETDDILRKPLRNQYFGWRKKSDDKYTKHKSKDTSLLKFISDFFGSNDKKLSKHLHNKQRDEYFMILTGAHKNGQCEFNFEFEPDEAHLDLNFIKKKAREMKLKINCIEEEDSIDSESEDKSSLNYFIELQRSINKVTPIQDQSDEKKYQLDFAVQAIEEEPSSDSQSEKINEGLDEERGIGLSQSNREERGGPREGDSSQSSDSNAFKTVKRHTLNLNLIREVSQNREEEEKKSETNKGDLSSIKNFAQDLQRKEQESNVTITSYIRKLGGTQDPQSFYGSYSGKLMGNLQGMKTKTIQEEEGASQGEQIEEPLSGSIRGNVGFNLRKTETKHVIKQSPNLNLLQTDVNFKRNVSIKKKGEVSQFFTANQRNTISEYPLPQYTQFNSINMRLTSARRPSDPKDTIISSRNFQTEKIRPEHNVAQSQKQLFNPALLSPSSNNIDQDSLVESHGFFKEDREAKSIYNQVGQQLPEMRSESSLPEDKGFNFGNKESQSKLRDFNPQSDRKVQIVDQDQERETLQSPGLISNGAKFMASPGRNNDALSISQSSFWSAQSHNFDASRIQAYQNANQGYNARPDLINPTQQVRKQGTFTQMYPIMQDDQSDLLSMTSAQNIVQQLQKKDIIEQSGRQKSNFLTIPALTTARTDLPFDRNNLRKTSVEFQNGLNFQSLNHNKEIQQRMTEKGLNEFTSSSSRVKNHPRALVSSKTVDQLINLLTSRDSHIRFNPIQQPPLIIQNNNYRLGGTLENVPTQTNLVSPRHHLQQHPFNSPQEEKESSAVFQSPRLTVDKHGALQGNHDREFSPILNAKTLIGDQLSVSRQHSGILNTHLGGSSNRRDRGGLSLIGSQVNSNSIQFQNAFL